MDVDVRLGMADVTERRKELVKAVVVLVEVCPRVESLPADPNQYRLLKSEESSPPGTVRGNA